jgi:hypothetical protein
MSATRLSPRDSRQCSSAAAQTSESPTRVASSLAASFSSRPESTADAANVTIRSMSEGSGTVCFYPNISERGSGEEQTNIPSPPDQEHRSMPPSPPRPVQRSESPCQRREAGQTRGTMALYGQRRYRPCRRSQPTCPQALFAPSGQAIPTLRTRLSRSRLERVQYICHSDEADPCRASPRPKPS